MINNNLVVIVFLGWIIVGCVDRQSFVRPIVVNSKVDLTHYKGAWSFNYLSANNPIFIGKYISGGTIDINPGKLTHQCDGIGSPSIDSADTNGLEILPDYNQTVYFNWDHPDTVYAFYPIFVVNRTPSIKVFYSKDSHGFGLQEARNPNFMNLWHPIEFESVDMCGNGGGYTILKSNEFILLLFPKYKGDLETSMRVRIKNLETIYVSHDFKGVINQNQFRYSERRKELDSLTLTSTYSNLFYGTSPFEIDSIKFND